MTISLKQTYKELTYFKNRVTTNQKLIIDSQKNQKEHKHKIRKWSHKKKHKEKGTKKKHRINWKTRFKMAINTYISIITLNVNGLNAPIKRQSGRLDLKKEKSLQYAAYNRLTLG